MHFRYALALTLLVPAATSAHPEDGKIANSDAGGFAAISVVDIDSSASWYVSQLGFEIIASGERPAQAMKYALLRKDNHLVEILQREGMKRDPVEDRSWRHGVFKLGYWVADLESQENILQRSCAEFLHGIVSPPGENYRTFAVRDPDGNTVQFFGR